MNQGAGSARVLPMRITCGALSLLLTLTVGALIVPASARADLSSEVAQGQDLAESVQSGSRDCSQLSEADFELVGEFAMDSYLGNRTAHEAMNARMTQMMGEQGEAAMHTSLGHRYTGCPGGADGAWAMPMAGMMGGAGDYGSGYWSGSDDYDGGSNGPMMGFQHPGPAADGGGIGAAAVVGIALGAALLGGLMVAAAYRLGRRSTGD